MNEFPAPQVESIAPRASRIALPELAGLGTELWMGGSQSLVGEPVLPGDLDQAIVIDCAGELPRGHRTAALRYLPRVFADIEAEPYGFDRLASLVHELATTLTARPEGVASAPRRVYVFCQYGLNRSGLVTGLLMRALGATADDALAGVRLARPGALNNLTFGRLIAEWRCPHDASSAGPDEPTSASR